jgi:hypothetical protein
MHRHATPAVAARLSFAALLLLSACDLLPIDDFEPTGSSFALNADIELVSITGSPQTSDYGPMTMAMTISSRSGTTETDRLPAGLCFRRRRTENQHIAILKQQEVTTGTGTRVCQLGAFCLNRNRFQPNVGDTYDLGPVTDNAGLRQIIGLIAAKDISDGNDMWMVQRAVYLVTDSTGLTQAYIDSLNALPPATGRR